MTIWIVVLLALMLPFTIASAQQKTTAGASFKDLAARAAAARDADHVEEATSLYRRALALRPAWAEGWFYLGTLHYDRNQFAPAARAFRKVIALQPKSGTALAMLGLSEFQLGLDDASLKHLTAAKEIGVADNPDLKHAILFDEALLLQRSSRFEGAQQALEALCQENVQREDALSIFGMVQLRLRTTDNLATVPPASQILPRLGHAGCLAAQKRYDEARPEYEGLVKEFPGFPNIHYAFGNFLLNVPDIPAAKEQFEQEIKNNPADVRSRLKIAAALYRTDSATGLPYAEQAVRLDPNVALGHYLYGLLLLDTDDYKKAIPELEAAQKGLPDEPKLYFALGTAYARAGRNADAERARAKFLKLQKKQSSEQ